MFNRLIIVIRRFIKNPLIILFFLGNTTRYAGIIGYYMFYAKYIESQYRQSSSSTSMLIGTSSLIPIAFWILSGGQFISWFKPRARTFFIFLFLVEFLVSVFTMGSGIFLGCQPIKLANKNELSMNNSFSLQSSCNSHCECTTRIFTPICDTKTETTYFSPCHAGCNSFDAINGTFSNCSCVVNNMTTRKVIVRTIENRLILPKMPIIATGIAPFDEVISKASDKKFFLDRCHQYKWTSQPWLAFCTKEIHPLVWERLMTAYLPDDDLFSTTIDIDSLRATLKREHLDFSPSHIAAEMMLS
ncbi:hypothetical protein RDWZM_009802 [Blomia tropicalis]|uniref:Kazal-like domain-containing protein n=1 Tax=Blomia tropicalis TaxID=40697 RepID=A0A9Q0M791_BLOTA|nr:hypothetical protein RDWZM_009802 [Blomia tropicalis]